MIKPLREKIIKLHNVGYSYGDIAKELNLKRTTVAYNIKTYGGSEVSGLPKATGINKKEYTKLLDEIKWEKDNLPRPNEKKLMSKKALSQYYNQLYTYDDESGVLILINNYIYTDDILKIKE